MTGPFINPPLTQRIRDVTVAEEIAARAGVDEAPELVELSPIVHPVIPLAPRPPLAVSGYFPGTIGTSSAAVASNTSQVGIFISGVGGAIGRVNWVLAMNNTGADQNLTLRRVDSPFTGFPSVRAVPGYINAGGQVTGRVFSVTKSDTVAASGDLIAEIFVRAGEDLLIPGPWILNDGILLMSNGTVNTLARAQFGYEVWPAFRIQPPG